MIRLLTPMVYGCFLLLSVLGCQKEEAGTLRVTVTNPDGRVEGVMISLDPGGQSMLTDTTGMVEFVDISPLDYLVEASHPEFGMATGLVSVKDEETSDFYFFLEGRVNRPPEIELVHPTNIDNAIFRNGEDVYFFGNVQDDRDEASALSVRWTSSLDGELSTERAEPDGTSTFLRDDLTVGEHLIRFEVTDTEGRVATDSVTIQVVPMLQFPTIVSVEQIGTDLKITWEEWERPGDFEYQLWRYREGETLEDLLFSSSERSANTYIDSDFPFNKEMRYFLVVNFPSHASEISELVSGRVDLPAITLQNTVVALTADARRPYLYALDQTSNQLLFINTNSLAVESALFVGANPQDLSLDLTGDTLYAVAEGSNQIAVVDLINRQISHYLPLPQAITSGGRIEYLAGGYLAVGAAPFVVSDLFLLRASDGLLLDVTQVNYFGLHANLERNALFTYQTNSSASELVRFVISPNQQWQITARQIAEDFGSKRLSLSTDGRVVMYHTAKYRATDLTLLGRASEQLHATNRDGSRALGAEWIWDMENFIPLGPSRIGVDFTAYDAANNRLFSHEMFSNLILVSPF
ncbi:hypothetical protein QWY85_11690 [Neolewinella lacunae]|uniref:Uncharacterized protein n=1 Tax=Neolewinella lacunae TaxID=1517758 RepID=A0A923PJF6_9BACT|nr:hypothetical protein [Neolewinella lacunae]MBC6993786.1 hypothetical protein [Neolewinella lacunae]MDN3635323.1 hypothetical protein [Neolewinella lacunae]